MLSMMTVTVLLVHPRKVYGMRGRGGRPRQPPRVETSTTQTPKFGTSPTISPCAKPVLRRGSVSRRSATRSPRFGSPQPQYLDVTPSASPSASPAGRRTPSPPRSAAYSPPRHAGVAPPQPHRDLKTIPKKPLAAPKKLPNLNGIFSNPDPRYHGDASDEVLDIFLMEKRRISPIIPAGVRAAETRAGFLNRSIPIQGRIRSGNDRRNYLCSKNTEEYERRSRDKQWLKLMKKYFHTHHDFMDPTGQTMIYKTYTNARQTLSKARLFNLTEKDARELGIAEACFDHLSSYYKSYVLSQKDTQPCAKMFNIVRKYRKLEEQAYLAQLAVQNKLKRTDTSSESETYDLPELVDETTVKLFAQARMGGYRHMRNLLWCEAIENRNANRHFTEDSTYKQNLAQVLKIERLNEGKYLASKQIKEDIRKEEAAKMKDYEQKQKAMLMEKAKTV